MARVRITGRVLQTQRQKFGSGEREFRFVEAHVQTGPITIQPVRFTDAWDNSGHEVPRAGDVIDIEAEVGAFAGRNGVTVSLSALAPFDEAYVMGLAQSA